MGFADRVIDWTTATSTGYWLPASTTWRKSLCPLLAESYADQQKSCRGACERMAECNVINYCPPQGSAYYGHANNKSCLDVPLVVELYSLGDQGMDAGRWHAHLGSEGGDLGG